jgi:MFS family permease
VEVARRLEAAGRVPEAVYVGAIFPFARTRGPAGRALSWLEHRRSNRQHAVWLKARGVDMDELEPAQADRIIANMRADGDRAEEYFGELMDSRVTPLRAPVVSVVGERDPATDYYPERYREWHFLTGRCAVVVLDEAGHFFLKYRADELAEILSTVHPALDRPDAAGLTEPARAGTGWWLHAASTHEPEPAVLPSLRRFGAVAAGQLVSLAGSALTAWAVPVWILLTTGSLLQFSLFAAAGLVPALLVGPLAGAVVDRSDRRRVLQAAGAAAGLVQLALGLLYWSEQLQPWHLYVGVAAVSVAASFQRLAFTSAIPQLVPKRFLGNANGIAQLSGGFAMLLVPLAAAGLLAALGLGTILLLDVLSYAAAIGVLAVTRFPDTLARRRREPLMTEIAAGIGYSWRDPALRAMLLFSALVNLFLGPALILVTPLVLAFADLGAVGAVSFAEALGAIAGGLVFTVWGGPARRRMHGLLVMTLVLAACCVVTGLRPSVLVVAAGVFGTAASLAVIQSIYTTIVQVKVPQRYHGRVFALNLVIAWGTLPLGYAVLAPLASAALQPLLAPGGALAGTLGAVYGVGEGRGLGLVFLVVALAVTALTVAGMRTRVLSRFDAEVPDALPDDLVGLRTLQARGVATRAPGVPRRTAGA